MKLTKEEMIEVFQLRTRRTSWENLGLVFKVSPNTLKRYYKMAEADGFAIWQKPVKPQESPALLNMFDALSGFCFAHSDLEVIVDANTGSTYEWGEVHDARRKIKELINFANSHGIKENTL